MNGFDFGCLKTRCEWGEIATKWKNIELGAVWEKKHLVTVEAKGHGNIERSKILVDLEAFVIELDGLSIEEIIGLEECANLLRLKMQCN